MKKARPVKDDEWDRSCVEWIAKIRNSPKDSALKKAAGKALNVTQSTISRYMNRDPKKEGWQSGRSRNQNFVRQVDQSAPMFPSNTALVASSSAKVDSVELERRESEKGEAVGPSECEASTSSDMHIIPMECDGNRDDAITWVAEDECVIGTDFTVLNDILNARLVRNRIVLEYGDGSSHAFGRVKFDEDSPEIHYNCVGCRTLYSKNKRKGILVKGGVRKIASLVYSAGKVRIIKKEHNKECSKTPKWKQMAQDISREGRLKVKRKEKSGRNSFIDILPVYSSPFFIQQPWIIGDVAA